MGLREILAEEGLSLRASQGVVYPIKRPRGLEGILYSDPQSLGIQPSKGTGIHCLHHACNLAGVATSEKNLRSAPGISWSEAQAGDVVRYGGGVHWGVVSDPSKKLVNSQWGGSGAFIHPVEMVPRMYGSSYEILSTGGLKGSSR